MKGLSASNFRFSDTGRGVAGVAPGNDGEGSFEFVRDPWVKGSFAMAFPEALPGPTLE